VVREDSDANHLKNNKIILSDD